MSDKELNRFLSDLDSDEGLNRAVHALRPAAENAISVPAEDLVSFARQRGYELELEDFKPAAGELGESDLDGVVGGATTPLSALGFKINSITVDTAKWITITPYKWY
ncbi:MAG: Nif11 family protein [Gammaproteobacteria bacterium]|nr:Nif11 family protein [Gammaproteobacteria bacterium]